MPVQIPPWLSIDPIAPAHIALAANAQRNQAEASARSAALAREELEVRQEQQAAMAARAQRAQQIEQAQQAQQAAQIQQRLAIKQQEDEARAEMAARQFKGLKGFQADVSSGMAPHVALANNPDMFYGKPTALPGAIKAITPPKQAQWVGPVEGGAPGHFDLASGGVRIPSMMQQESGPLVAQDVVDTEGNPLGQKYVRGARGALHPATTGQLTPRERLNAAEKMAGMLTKQLEFLSPKEPEYAAVSAELKKYTEILGGAAMPKGAVKAPLTAAQKKNIAIELSKQHPDWSKKQVIDAVNNGGTGGLAEPPPFEEEQDSEEQ